MLLKHNTSSNPEHHMDEIFFFQMHPFIDIDQIRGARWGQRWHFFFTQVILIMNIVCCHLSAVNVIVSNKIACMLN